MKIPKILIAGDSIAWPLGYGPALRKLLEGIFDIREIPENTVWHRKMRPHDVKDQPFKTSENLLDHVYEWLIKPNYELIHLNCGLHDLCRRGGPDKDFFVPLRRYSDNLGQIASIIKNETDSILIWATITPIIENLHNAHKKRKGSIFFRYDRDVDSYNRASLKTMKRHKIQINDLHELIVTTGKEKCIAKDGVHLNRNFGRKYLANAVSKALNNGWKKRERKS